MNRPELSLNDVPGFDPEALNRELALAAAITEAQVKEFLDAAKAKFPGVDFSLLAIDNRRKFVERVDGQVERIDVQKRKLLTRKTDCLNLAATDKNARLLQNELKISEALAENAQTGRARKRRAEGEADGEPGSSSRQRNADEVHSKTIIR